MQTIYAMHQHQSDVLDKEEKFLYQSIENMQDLYLLLLSALVEIREKEEEYLDVASKKHLATKEERNPNRKFVSNIVLKQLAENEALQDALDDRSIKNWKNNDDLILHLIEEIKASELYASYMSKPNGSFEDEKYFVADLFSQIIAPNERLYDYLEDYKLTWLDDLPVVNTYILKQIKGLKE